ncbi:MAG: Gfo/Idh/MocA family oxidoreductase [Eubacteriales bacterium]|nr:Gfo/Idh/MocA family oxidoreductase [Eubacteriales bacterium]
MGDIGVGIIGHGFMGHEHETMLSEMEGIRLVGITDRDPEQLKDVKDGVTAFASVDKLLGSREIDTVIIAANNNQHLALVKKAAAAGKNIICEKPAALSVTDFDEMIRAVKENNVLFTVHQQRRYDPDFRIMKKLYEEKALGNVYTIKNQLYGFNGNMHDWHVYFNEGGGMLYDWGVHLIDQLLWMVDARVTSVYATVKNVINFEVDDFFNIQLRFSNGVTAEIELGTYYLKDDPGWFERHWFMGGDQGSAYADGFRPEGKIVRTTELLHNVSGARTMTAAGPTRSFGNPREGLIVTEPLPEVSTCHRNYFENYIRAYHGQEDFLVKAPEVRRVLCLMEAVRESGKTGKAIAFE